MGTWKNCESLKVVIQSALMGMVEASASQGPWLKGLQVSGMRLRLDLQKHLLGAGVINDGKGLGEGTGGRSRGPWMQQARPCASSSGNWSLSLKAEAFVLQ